MEPSNVRTQVSDYAQVPTDSFISRQAHLNLLQNHYERARMGHASVVMVVGEPGCGKTCLVTQFATWAVQEGAITLEGYAWGIEDMPPYLPLLEAIGQYIRTAPEDQLRNQAASDPEVLASFLPDLAARLGISLTSNLVSPEQQRWRFYKAFGSFLEMISTASPLLLLLDDVQQADTESLSLLCYIARHHPKAHLLILCTFREGELQQNPALVHTLAELTQYRVLTMLKVQLLSLLDVESIVLAYLGKPVNPAVRLLLYAKSEGNPFFAEELLHCWVEMRAIVQENEQWVLAASVDNLWPLGITNMIRQRLSRLHPETIEHLRIAALIGRTVDVSLLAALEDQEVEAVEDCLQEAVCACLIIPDQAGSFRFSQHVICKYLYHDMTTSRCRRLHGRVAHLLEARYGEEKSRGCKQLAELAHHFARSGDRLLGPLYAQRAAALALREYISQEFEVLIKESLQSIGGEKSILASLPSRDEYSCLKRPEEAHPCSQLAGRLLASVNDLEITAYLAQELGLVEWLQEVLRAAQGMLGQIQALEEKSLCPTDILLLIEQAAPLIAHIGHQPEVQSYARLLLELAHHLTDNQAVTDHQPLKDNNVLFYSQPDHRPLTRVGASSGTCCDL